MKISDKFIKANDKLCDFDCHVNAPLFRKKFVLDFEPEKAEITICGLGFYELYINGENITKGPLAPYISNTDDVCYYDNYNIERLLKKGENIIAAVLGNGFRNPFGGIVWGFEKSKHRGVPILALCLEAENGQNKFELEADESFKTHPSPILLDDLRMGYRYDSRLAIENWNNLALDDFAWDYAKRAETPKGKAKLCNTEPIRITEIIYPVSITHYDELPFAYETTLKDAKPLKNAVRKNVYLYDFGVNNAGVTRLKINGKPGQKITVKHGEYMCNGRFSINNIMFPGHEQEEIDKYLEYGQTDVFICKGGEEVFTPRFKYDGFRYAYVEGLEEEQATADSLVYLVMHSGLEERASFSCSDSVLNKLQEMVRRSDLSNFYYFPTDCPHREKNGWTGDISVSAEHIILNLTAEKSLAEYLESVRCAQNEQGALPGIVPTGGWGFEWGNGPAWDSVCVNLPYYIYKYTGDKAVIEENASMITRYLSYISDKRDENGLVAVGLGDWVDPYRTERGYITAPLVFTDSAEVYDMAVKSCFLFSQIGKKDEADKVKNLAYEMREAIRKHLISENMTVSGECQTSQAMAIELGLFNGDEIQTARKRLIEIVHRDGDINACGMIGLRYIFDALTHADEYDLAYDIITSTNRTCYGSWVKAGATTMWEDFNGETAKYAGSQNHHFLGDISRWFIQEIVGIKPNPTADNIHRFELTPHFIKKLNYAEAYLSLPSGKVSCEWRSDGENIIISVNAPINMQGKIVLPKGYTFENGTAEAEIVGNMSLTCKMY